MPVQLFLLASAGSSVFPSLLPGRGRDAGQGEALVASVPDCVVGGSAKWGEQRGNKELETLRLYNEELNEQRQGRKGTCEGLQVRGSEVDLQGNVMGLRAVAEGRK